jgi:uncharacterized protein YecT (DUF1311 family)
LTGPRPLSHAPADSRSRLRRTKAVLAAGALLAANAAFSETPLATCYANIGNRARTAVAPCLKAMLEEAEKDMASALAARTRDAAELAKASGRDQSARSLRASQQQFVHYRKAHCRYIMDTLDAGTGAGDAQLDCMVRLTRARAEELHSNP